jgi:acyl-CoA synthetase (AMP-forming)/AMP-acid ligase II
LAYSRHFLILTGFGVLVAWMSKSSLPYNLYSAFALYGTLHAAAMVLSLNPRRLTSRRCLFIAAAAALSVATVAVGMLGRQVAALLPETLGRYSLLAVSAAAGAVAYGIAIRLFGILALAPRAIAKISLGCMLAAAAALLTIRATGLVGPWWIAVLWWYAFSLGLWCFHGRSP